MSVRFDTQTIPAEVVLAEGQTIKGSLHLQRSAIHQGGLETPLELLNRAEAFFAVSLASGEVVLVPKAQVAYVSCELMPVEDQDDRLAAATILTLRVVTTGGTEFQGSTAVELPRGHTRALDFLNQPEPFFSLETETARVLIHRSQVRFVSPLD